VFEGMMLNLFEKLSANALALPLSGNIVLHIEIMGSDSIIPPERSMIIDRTA
jgi:hypothetical protein